MMKENEMFEESENVSIIKYENPRSRGKIFLSLKQKLLKIFADFPEKKSVLIGKNKFPMIVFDFIVPESSLDGSIEELSEEMEIKLTIYHSDKEDFALILTFINKLILNLKYTNTVSWYQYYFYEPDKNFLNDIKNDKSLDEKSRKQLMDSEMYGTLNFWNRNEDWTTYTQEEFKKILSERAMFQLSTYYSRKNNPVFSIQGIFCLDNKNPKKRKNLEKTSVGDINTIEIIKYDQDDFMEVIHFIQELIYEKIDEQSIEKINNLIDLNKCNFIDLNDTYQLYFIYFKFGSYYENMKDKGKSHQYYSKCIEILEKLKKENDNLYDEDDYTELLEKLKN